MLVSDHYQEVHQQTGTVYQLYAEIRRQLAAIGNNINQIARTVNARGFASGEDIAAITAAQETIWNIAERL